MVLVFAHQTGRVHIAPYSREYVILFVTAVPVQLKGTVFSACITHPRIQMMPAFVVLCGKVQVVTRLFKNTVSKLVIPP